MKIIQSIYSILKSYFPSGLIKMASSPNENQNENASITPKKNSKSSKDHVNHFF